LRTGKIGRREFVTRALALGLSLGSIEMLLNSCRGLFYKEGGFKWSTWGNPGEVQRFQLFTQKYNQEHHTDFELIPVPSSINYASKLLIEINGGVAPDVFYAGDGDIIKFVQNETIVDLTSLLTGPQSQSHPDEYIPGLWGAARTRSGKIYGVPVDCNPLIIWYNKTVLQSVGLSPTLPQELYDQGKWTRNAFMNIVEKVRAKGKYGYILDDWTLQFWSWCTTNGGQIYADKGYGDFIAHEDPKSLDALQWLANSIRQKQITFAGSLPKGQGDDLAFIGNQVAFVSAGRWYLPEFRQTSGLQYDIIPFPSFSGKMEPAGVALAYLTINKKTKDLNTSFQFYTNFLSKVGQHFRLQGGGNAVPSIRGAEPVVLEGNLPRHAHYFIEARNMGYGLLPAEMGAPGLSADIQTLLDPAWLQGKNLKTLLGQVATMANPRIKQSQQQIK